MRRLFVLCLLAIVAGIPAPHWPRGAPVHVWVDTLDAPAPGVMLVQRAMKTWTDAAAGRIVLEPASRRAGADTL